MHSYSKYVLVQRTKVSSDDISFTAAPLGHFTCLAVNPITLVRQQLSFTLDRSPDAQRWAGTYYTSQSYERQTQDSKTQACILNYNTSPPLGKRFFKSLIQGWGGRGRNKD